MFVISLKNKNDMTATTISFNDLPEAVAELTKKVDELYRVINKVQPQETADQFFTVKETAKFLHLSVPTIYSKAARRELPFMKRTKRLYFAKSDLEDYLKDGRVKTVSEIEEEADQFLSSKNRRA
jgi:excisionase family DNA binding protein